MALIRQASFSGGEVAPDLQSRTDLAARAAALRTLRNFIPTPTGAATNRPGFGMCVETKDSTKVGRLVPFTFSTSQSYVLELGDLYFRVIQNGAYVLDALSAILTVTTPYTAAQLPRIQFIQSGDILTLFHPSHAPREIRRVSQSNWTLADFSVVRTVTAPGLPSFLTSPQTTPDSTHVVRAWEWVVTAVKGGQESLPSPTLSSAAIVVAPDRVVNLQTPGTTGASYYNWYRGKHGVHGYVGNSTTLQFVDDGAVPNYSDRPPTQRDPFLGSEYPSVATYHQQRLVTANSASYPQRVLTSRVGDFKNFDYSMPQKDDDSLDFTVASRQYEEVRALVSLRHLFVLTANTEFAVDGGDRPMSPTNINLVPLSSNGCSFLRPLIIDGSVLYLTSQLASVRELVQGGQGGGDVSLVAHHLLASSGRTIVDWTFQRLPYPVAWMVRDDGRLLSLTYAREHGVAAWATHDTDGAFESVCAIPEGGEDVVYAIVRRTVNGATKRYVERLASRVVPDKSLGVFLDCSTVRSGAAVSVITGLGHLEGRYPSLLIDGVPYVSTSPVTGGSLTLPLAGAKVVVGLPYTPDIELLDLYAQSREQHAELKSVSRVIWEVDDTTGLSGGETFNELTPWTPPLGFASGDNQFVVPVMSSWNRGGRAVLRQTNPLPVSVLGVSRDVTFGGV